MAELANCPHCGAVFVKGIREICQACYKEEEKAFQIVYDFLRVQKNREATLLEIVEATGVEKELIIKFIKENRLRKSQFPKLGYPCDRCGKDIRSGKLCNQCAAELKKDLEQHDKLEQLSEERKNAEKQKVHTYFVMDKYKK
ncbi:TIGR03826 family flagellar region protein [Virgibacillus sp. LDC-1]|nr:TIGR03826 family flagellar region protein [Virgibacillus sp. LDC-1]